MDYNIGARGDGREGGKSPTVGTLSKREKESLGELSAKM
jgi:hypothetical protein